MKSIGEKLWDQLREAGGYVYTMADGRQFVRFNPGRHPSAELVTILKNQSEALKAYVAHRHIEMDRLGWSRPAPRGIGSSGCIEGPVRKRRGGGTCDCNGAERSVYAHNALSLAAGTDAGAGGGQASGEAKPGADGGCAANFCAFGASGKEAGV